MFILHWLLLGFFAVVLALLASSDWFHSLFISNPNSITNNAPGANGVMRAYGRNVLALNRWIRRLIVRFIHRHYPEIHYQFRRILER